MTETTFSVDWNIPPADLNNVVFQALVGAAWAVYSLGAKVEILQRRRPLTLEERRRGAISAFTLTLERMPEANPFRVALLRFITEVVLPAVERDQQKPGGSAPAYRLAN